MILSSTEYNSVDQTGILLKMFENLGKNRLVVCRSIFKDNLKRGKPDGSVDILIQKTLVNSTCYFPNNQHVSNIMIVRFGDMSNPFFNNRKSPYRKPIPCFIYFCIYIYIYIYLFICLFFDIVKPETNNIIVFWFWKSGGANLKNIAKQCSTNSAYQYSIKRPTLTSMKDL